MLYKTELTTNIGGKNAVEHCIYTVALDIVLCSHFMLHISTHSLVNEEIWCGYAISNRSIALLCLHTKYTDYSTGALPVSDMDVNLGSGLTLDLS